MSALTTLSGRPPSRLGLAGSPSTAKSFVETAFQAGANYFFFYNSSFEGMITGLRGLATRNREEAILATGTEARDPDTAGSELDAACRALGVGQVDVFFAEYVNPADEMDSKRRCCRRRKRLAFP